MSEQGVMSRWASVWFYIAAAFVIVAAAVWALYPEGGFRVVILAGCAASVSFAVVVAVWRMVLRIRDRRRF
ncbi:hypothetical protein CH263_20135 [Rhodococcus sp. 06-1059B-a]|nr:hypothetical protein [Rhodococcus sp. 06-1059B-a]OZD60803.1 hypothetical protein CH263_20135 [Rhodococcus sp. 06-1059B-a]